MSTKLTLPPPPTALRNHQIRLPNPPTRNARTRLLAQRPLAYHLSILGVKPFDEHAIDAYKFEQVFKLRHPQQEQRRFKSYVITLAVIAFFAYGVGSNLHNVWTMIGMICAGTIASLIAWVSTGPNEPIKRPLAQWREVSLGHFLNTMLQMVPEPAVELAEEVKTRLPSASVTVEYLDKDPIMWIKHERPGTNRFVERYAVQVWGEPDFVP